MRQKGFTLIELVIVFSIIALLSITGIASFSAFSERQQVSNAIGDLRTLLNVARTRTLAQVNGTSANYCSSSEQFGGYVVIVCCTGKGSQTNCPSIGATCTGNEDYTMFETCTNGSNTTYKPIQGGIFPTNVVVDSSTTTRTFQFAPITGVVSFGLGGPVSAGSVTLKLSTNLNYSGTVSVTSIGAIQ